MLDHDLPGFGDTPLASGPVPLRKAAVNELVSLKPTVNAISVTEDEGFTNSVLARCDGWCDIDEAVGLKIA